MNRILLSTKTSILACVPVSWVFFSHFGGNGTKRVSQMQGHAKLHNTNKESLQLVYVLLVCNMQGTVKNLHMVGYHYIVLYISTCRGLSIIHTKQFYHALHAYFPR